jgi:hypothetical protein
MPDLLALIVLLIGTIGSMILAGDEIFKNELENGHFIGVSKKIWGIICILLAFLIPTAWISYSIGEKVSDGNGIIYLLWVLFFPSFVLFLTWLKGKPKDKN